MTTAATAGSGMGAQVLEGQTVVVIGGSSGIGLETARLARLAGADVILTGRNPDRLERAAAEVDAQRTAAFDATDSGALGRFFAELPRTVDHIMVTGPGAYFAPLAELDHEQALRNFDGNVWLPVAVAQLAVGRVRPGGTLVFMGGTGGGKRAPGLSLIAAGIAALSALVANLAVEVAPIRANLIGAGFVDTALSASLLGEGLEARRAELRAGLPIARVVGPADVAALALHLMTNTAVTGATYDIDGGQQLVSNLEIVGRAPVGPSRCRCQPGNPRRRSASARHQPGRAGPTRRDAGWSGCRPSLRSSPAAMRIVKEPCQWPSARLPQARSIRTASRGNGSQSIPRSSSQSQTARIGCGQPGRFSYPKMKTNSASSIAMGCIVP